MNLENATIIITGANGLVGVPTIKKCLQENAAHVFAVDINVGKDLKYLAEKYKKRLTIIQTDLTDYSNCKNLFVDKKINFVFHLAGIKGSPIRAKNSPADYFFPMLMFNTNMIKASFEADVDWFVYTSSVGVYQPADIMVEDDVWKTMPSANDWYPGWAKRCGELALETLQKQYNWNKFSIIRPANIFGENDNFSPEATVIASNIYKLFNSGDVITCWGDGSPKRDFVFADDVADAVLDVVKKEVNDIINFGSGKAVSIKETLELLVEIYKEIFSQQKVIEYDTSKPNGDLYRCLSIEKQTKYDILPKTPFKTGLMKSILAYKRKNRNFDSLLEKGYYIGHVSELLESWDDFISTIDHVKKFDKDPDHYKYRNEIVGVDVSSEIKLDEIDNRRKEILKNNWEIFQQWYISSPEIISGKGLQDSHLYFEDIIGKFIFEIYTEISIERNNINYIEQFSIYENDDFVIPHHDGQNIGRLCVVLIYLSPNWAKDDGGQLVINDSSNLISVNPALGTYVILDFSKHNLEHAVTKVKNNATRNAYLAFVYNTEKEGEMKCRTY
jgi:GDP-L-fucose synthase